MSGSYIYDMADMVWCGLEMIENKQFLFCTIYSYKLQFIGFIDA